MDDLQSEVVYVAGIAKIFGKTEASIREGIRRGVDWIPPGFKLSGQHAWLKSDVISFLKDMATGVKTERIGVKINPKPGRKRRIPPVIAA